MDTFTMDPSDVSLSSFTSMEESQDNSSSNPPHIKLLTETDYLQSINQNTTTNRICSSHVEDIQQSEFQRNWTKLDYTLKLNRCIRFLRTHLNTLYEYWFPSYPNHPSKQQLFHSFLHFMIDILVDRYSSSKVKEFITYDSEHGEIQSIKNSMITIDINTYHISWKLDENHTKKQKQIQTIDSSNITKELNAMEKKQLDNLEFTI